MRTLSLLLSLTLLQGCSTLEIAAGPGGGGRVSFLLLRDDVRLTRILVECEQSDGWVGVWEAAGESSRTTFHYGETVPGMSTLLRAQQLRPGCICRIDVSAKEAIGRVISGRNYWGYDTDEVFTCRSLRRCKEEWLLRIT
jgi:hypothetical protein